MYEIIGLIGPSGAGKDYLKKMLLSRYSKLEDIVMTTSRPPRDYEINGKDYSFLSLKDFKDKIKEGDFLSYSFFNGWGYGTQLSNLKTDSLNIGVFNLEEAKKIAQNGKVRSHFYLVSATDKERLLRSLNREKNPDCLEICRRFLSDSIDFSKKRKQIPIEGIVTNDNQNLFFPQSLMDLLNGQE